MTALPTPAQLQQAHKSRRRAVIAFAGTVGASFTAGAVFITAQVGGLPEEWRKAALIAGFVLGLLAALLSGAVGYFGKDSGAGQIPEG